MAVILTTCCESPMIRDLPPRGEPRCMVCGHRRALDGTGDGVIASRKLPFWLWPGELLGRCLAATSRKELWSL